MVVGPFKERIVSMAKVEILLLKAIVFVSRFFSPALHAAALSSLAQGPGADRPRKEYAFSPEHGQVSPSSRLRRAA
jgi:hypothetical protein